MKSFLFSCAMLFVFGLAGAQKVPQRPFKVIPEDIPNEGILFVDHQKTNRSGHGGHAVTECSNGDILAFYMNTWGEEQRGHGSGGWSSFKRSKDGGKTWSEPVDLKYSWDVWNQWDKEVHSAMVFGAVTAPDGTVILTLVRFADASWHKRLPPVYLLSHDNGYTWSEPMEFDKNASVYDIAMTFNTNFVHNNEVFVVFFGGPENPSIGPYSLYVSNDNGKTFSKRSVLPFDHRNYYCAASALDNGDIIVYSYPYPTTGRLAKSSDTDEKNIPYVISKDDGRTWSEVKRTYFAKSIRNPQMAGKVGDYYFMQGRSGSYGENPDNFVLYSSKDGINWDDGVYLVTRQHTPRAGRGDFYSGNAVVGKYSSSSPRRLLVQADMSYDGPKVNIYHWFVEVPGAKK
jgi:hypothetical protein